MLLNATNFWQLLISYKFTWKDEKLEKFFENFLLTMQSLNVVPKLSLKMKFIISLVLLCMYV